MTKEKQCRKCKEWHPNTPEYFKLRRNGLSATCNNCTNATLKNTFGARVCLVCKTTYTPKASNQKTCSPECAQQWQALTYLRHGPFVIYARDSFKCIYCGRSSIEDGVKLHADHIYPETLGGLATVDNLVTACETCNLEKHDTVIDAIDRIRAVVRTRNRENNYPDGMPIRLNVSSGNRSNL